MWKEFKDFVMKGPVLSLAVGVIIGAAFGKIIDSMVKDIIMPLVGAIFGKVDFTNLFVVLGDVPAGVPHTYDALTKAGVNVLAYGNFITILINFLLLALGVFALVKFANKVAPEKADEPEGPTEDVVLLREIRDSLKKIINSDKHKAICRKNATGEYQWLFI